MDKKITLAIILLILSVIILFLPTMINWKGIFHDDLGMAEFPIQYSLASNLQKGIIPIWNSYTWGGAAPFNFSLSNAGGNYYPNWLFYLFADLDNLDSAYWLITILPLFSLYFLAAAGMFVLLKKIIRCNYFPALVGAIIYIYSPVFVYYYGSTNSLIMQAWLPWLLYIYITNVRKPRLWKVFLGGVIFAFVIIAGRPHFLPFIMIIWGGFVFSEIFVNRHSKGIDKFKKPLLPAFFIFIIGILFSAVYWIPLLDTVLHSELYTQLTADVALSENLASLAPSYLITLFLPDFFGGVTGKNFIFKPLIFCEANMSGGLITAFLVIFSIFMLFIFFSRRKRNKIYRRFIIMGFSFYLISILCAMGKNTFFYRLLVGWIPIVGGFPFPIRYRFIQCFATSLLVAIGLSYLISSKFFIKKYLLKRLCWGYIIVSFAVIILVLLLPQDRGIRDLWSGNNDYGIEGYYRLKAPAGAYTPRISRITKIRVFFDGESKGEIRYASNHQLLPRDGTLVKKYSVPEEGWYEFDVDIPPHRFVWVYPVSGFGSIGYWVENHDPGFKFNDGQWHIDMGYNSISMYQAPAVVSSSLYSKLKNNSVAKTPVIISFFYWLIGSVILIIGIYFLPSKKLGYLLGTIVVIEFLVFGMLAFYRCEYTDAHHTPFPEHYRYLKPSDHPMAQAMAVQLPAVVGNSKLRIASDYPYYDNFALLNSSYNNYALMGYGVYPLEKRFKHAIETAYGRPMDYGIYEKRIYPGSSAFLNNFSVGYFLGSDVGEVFPEEKRFSLPGNFNLFVHINPWALPRAYTQDKVIFASEEEQIKQLVFGDLRKAVYMDFDEKIKAEAKSKGGPQTDYSSHFELLQNKNKIKSVNFDNPNQVEADIEVSEPAMLVFTEVWHPGWKATVDGEPVRIHRVNYCQRGVWLGQGQHRVKLKFSPLAWRVGRGISLGSIILISTLVIVFGRKRKK